MRTSVVVAAALWAGCYHYAFEQRPSAGPEVTYELRVPTWVNGLVGTGRVDTRRYCADPVRTELRVTATDVLLSIVTLLVYTPHTLSVTCAAR
jgi:hypothetical protein